MKASVELKRIEGDTAIMRVEIVEEISLLHDITCDMTIPVDADKIPSMKLTAIIRAVAFMRDVCALNSVRLLELTEKGHVTPPPPE